MKLAEQSASTRKQSTSTDERIAKRRGKFPHLAGFEPVEVLDGTAALVTSASQGGIYIEYLDGNGNAHAVPVESVIALGFAEPVASK